MKTEKTHAPALRCKAMVRWACSLPLRMALRFFLWLYDDEAAIASNADLHRKIIWELRNALKQINT